ncbi:sodium:proton antiporter [Weissella diestrammenae]|uniref:Sodium:proton antiporter n=1 Tax=Weissella diestrammenae TaxID=1162633 RepID=A0A7G9T584_9LACO|nr:sodium:proton antiporter [Weissella diestrammenae]MCM0583114.1 sodium:proton antiporter [Weissella diestrammenae]QNN75259.1 sodium:proton antiporter [Weissella diestrammenae]
MDNIYAVATIFCAMIVANLISQIFPRIPQAFFQISIGMALPFLPYFSKYIIELHSEWFMLIVIVPLIFFESYRTPLYNISANIFSILKITFFMAAVLIISISLIVQSTLGWPLVFGIILAAIITPTDATSLSAISGDKNIKSNIERILGLESLFIETTCLVIMSVAVQYVETQELNIFHGISRLPSAIIGGITIGFISGTVMIYLRQFMIRKKATDLSTHMMIQLLGPLAIYLFAEHLHCSGFLAVVVAGIWHNTERHRGDFDSAKLNNSIYQVWQILTKILGGVVFIMLGISVISIVKIYHEFNTVQLVTRIALAILIYATMLIIRFIFIISTNRLENSKDNLNEALLFSLGGVHGTKTIALALAIPIMIDSTHRFLYRDDILLIAMIVVLLSLIVPALSVSYFTTQKCLNYQQEEIYAVQTRMVSSALNYVSELPISDVLKQSVSNLLTLQIGWQPKHWFANDWNQAFKQLQTVRQTAIDAALENNALSGDAIIICHKLFKHNGKDKTPLIAQVRWYLWIIYYYFRHLMDGTKNLYQRDLKRVHHLEHQLKKYQKQITALSVMNQRHRRLREKIAWANKRLAYYHYEIEQNSDNPMMTSYLIDKRWKDAFNEIMAIINPAVDAYLTQLSAQNTDPVLIFALRERSRMDSDIFDPKLKLLTNDEYELYAMVLEEELIYLINSKKSGLISKTLVDELCSQINALQNLLSTLKLDDE